jgi:hypothetical protein
MLPESSSSRVNIFISLFFCLIVMLPDHAFAKTIHISVKTPLSLLDQPPCRLAVNDAMNLLKQAFPKAVINSNKNKQDILIILPSFPATIALQGKSGGSSINPPASNDSFRWVSTRKGGTTVLRLTANSPTGAANGIYALLQEKLGIRFIHPRQTIIPAHGDWPLPASFTFEGEPGFASRGFHLHTLHPTELTEQLHDPTRPNAFNDVAAYLDWLARNGQNSFQFFLLRGINRDSWIPHARRIVDYAHQRGINCGVEISLAMLQQQAFQAITLLRPFPSYRRQVDSSLSWLFQAPWDFISLEATMGEHLPFLGRLLPNVQSYFEQQVVQRYKSKLLYATHVICQENGEKVRRPNLATSGILIHTVMCYSATEPVAPVYGNENQRFMLEAAKIESKRRETWYWPESSYWVGFDSSVPLLLLPYLTSRWDDIQTTGNLHLNGHMTFTSGWEWGYWMVDWSIARWTWVYTDNSVKVPTSPVSRLNELFPDQEQRRLFKEALNLQNRYLKEKELLRFMAAMTPFSELPHPLDKPFQPDPGFDYNWLLNKATPGQTNAAVSQPLADLDAYADKMEHVAKALENRNMVIARGQSSSTTKLSLAEELTAGLQISALRARHRAITIKALLAKRDERAKPGRAAELLHQAQSIRKDAILTVRQQELRYRYPLDLLARQRTSMTAYPFGYLYPVTNLFFWDREEEQVRQGRFDALFMNLWDMRRTLGLESLFLR